MDRPFIAASLHSLRTINDFLNFSTLGRSYTTAGTGVFSILFFLASDGDPPVRGAGYEPIDPLSSPHSC